MKVKRIPRGSLAMTVEAAKCHLYTLNHPSCPEGPPKNLGPVRTSLGTSIQMLEDWLETTDHNGHELKEDE